MPRRVRQQELSLDYYVRSRYTRTRLVLWRFQWITQFRLSHWFVAGWRQELTIAFSHITGLFGTRRGFWQCWRHCSVVTLSLLSLAFLWLYYFCPDSAGTLQGCHFMITSPGLSVAQQLLVTLYPSLRPALSVVLEVDSYDDSRGRGGPYDESRGRFSRYKHVRSLSSRLDSHLKRG